MDERGLCARLARARSTDLRIRVCRAGVDDYQRLAHLHYRAKRPATIDLVLRADVTMLPGRTPLDTSEGRLAGVLVVSRPVLNGPWRDIAWPGRFHGDARERARAINDSLRCISRVIVDPRFRGLGVASCLVRAYLKRPITPATEALAVMGAFSPFFEAGGMTRIDMPPRRRDEHLLRALKRESVTLRSLAAWGSGEGGTRDPIARVEHAMRAWARASRATAGLRDAPLRDLAWACAGRLLRPATALAHGLGDWRVRLPKGTEHPEREGSDE